MVIDDSEEGHSVTFRPARLPRSMKVLYPRGGQALIDSWNLHAAFLGADWEGGIIGYVNVRELRSQETAWIADLVVDGAMRRQGVATQLLRAAQGWAIDRGLRRLTVETQTKNFPAIQFCLHRGLVFCGYNDLYYPNQDIAVFFGQVLR
ncbi:MAG: GNAT family N-acetyltransferase [Anaerolineae bacterium]